MRTVVAAVLMLTLLPTASEAGPEGRLKWLIVGMIAAQAADITTTSVALRRGCLETTYYGLQNNWAIGGVKAGGTIALAVTLPLAHSKKPKIASTVAWAQIASGVLGAA